MAVRGLLTCAIIAGTALSFNLIEAGPSGAAGTLDGWLALDGNIQYVSNGSNAFGWGNEGPPATGDTCTASPAGQVNVPGTHGLFNCGAPNGSTQAIPPKAVNGDSSIISQDFLTDPFGSQGSTGCSGDETTYADGQKYGGAASYTAPGSAPNSKTDLTNAYFVSRNQPQAPGDKELYFGLERLGNNGDVAADVEFLQAGIGLTGTCSAATLSMPREEGDFAIEFNFVNGGSVPAPVLDIWHCTGTNTGNPAVGTPCNPGSGAGYVSQTGLPSNVISLAENTGVAPFPGDIPCGGWVCGSGTTVNTDEFVEGGIDLTAFAAIPGVGSQLGCSSSVIAESHESQSNTSNLTDFVGPGGFSTCLSGTTTTPILPTSQTIGNSWSDSGHVSGSNGTPTGTMTFYSCSPSQLATASSSTCSNTIGTQIPATTGFPNPATLDSSGNATSPPITPDEVGTWCFAGYYSGQAGKYAPSSDSSSDECFQVAPAPSGTTTQQSASLSGEGNLAFGGTVMDTAVVAGNPVGGAPTGSVTFYECGPTTSPANCTNTTGTQVGSGAVALTGVDSTHSSATSVAFTPDSLGTFCFAAYYGPPTSGGLYAASSDNTSGTPDANECVNVLPNTSTTTTQQSTTTSGPGSITIGATGGVTDTVTVAGNSTGGVPTGTVTFYVCGPFSGNELCTSTTTPVGTPTLTQIGATDSSTAVSDVFNPTAVGTYCFGAVYTPDGASKYLTSSDNQTGDVDNNECFAVNPATPVTTTQQSTTTSGSGSIVIGPDGTVSDTVTVAGIPFGGAPAGTVSFYLCGPFSGNELCTSTTTPAGTVALTQVGTTNNSTAVSTPVTATQVGTYCFGAVYNPISGGNYSASSDNQTGDVDTNECFTVNPAATATTTQQSGSTSGTGSVVLGKGVTDTATVTGNATAGAPTGDVSFFECGPLTAAGVCATGTAVGSAVALSSPTTNSASATSATFTPTTAGLYCFGAIFTPGPPNTNYNGSDDNRTGNVDVNECVNVTTPATAQQVVAPVTPPTPPATAIAFTGAMLSTEALIGLGLLAAGGILVLVGRRRRRTVSGRIG